MLQIVCSIFLVIIFFSIACLHFYWATGGRWAIDSVVPTNERGEKMLQTGVIACIVVAVGLILFAMYYLLRIKFIEFALPDFIMNSFGWIISGIFFIRAIGDFKYVGFTKKIRDTEFAKLDTLIYSKLCLVIAILGFMIEAMS